MKGRYLNLKQKTQKTLSRTISLEMPDNKIRM